MALGAWEQPLILLEFTARICHLLFNDLYFVDEMPMNCQFATSSAAVAFHGVSLQMQHERFIEILMLYSHFT